MAIERLEDECMLINSKSLIFSLLAFCGFVGGTELSVVMEKDFNCNLVDGGEIEG